MDRRKKSLEQLIPLSDKPNKNRAEYTQLANDLDGLNFGELREFFRAGGIAPSIEDIKNATP